MKRCVLCIAAAVVLVVVAVVLAVTLGRSGRSQTFEETFIKRCNQFKGNNCDEIWSTFQKVYVGLNPCEVPPDAYNPLFDLVPMNTPCSKTMFWSKTKGVVHEFTKKNSCFVTMEETLLGSVLDGLAWCGKEGSNETITDSCPGWAEPNCDNNPVRSFWAKGSERFAQAACGDASVMMNGSMSSPFDPFSIFASIEVRNLNKVQSLTVVLVTPENPKATCTDGSLSPLQQVLSGRIGYQCKQVSEAHLKECGSTMDTSCTSCW